MVTKRFLFYTLCMVSCIVFAFWSSCKREPAEPDNNNIPDTLAQQLKVITPSAQRAGDATKGYNYLIYGNYLASGIPFQAFKNVFGSTQPNELNRTGDNAEIPFNYTAVNAHNGQRIVSPNCLQCHADKINNELIVGLGNTTSDYTTSNNTLVTLVDLYLTNLYGQNSPQWEAYSNFRRGTLAVAPNIITKTRGVNPADNIAAVLAAHRQLNNLEWSEAPLMNILPEVVPTDVPAWWQLKKKNSMFFTALGRGDFARIMMASNLLTMTDSTEAATVDANFANVAAYIKSIEAPPYPNPTNSALVTQGETIFNTNCAACHGTYNNGNETYPNYLVNLDFVKTDPKLIEAYTQYGDYVQWYNNSWLGKGNKAGKLVIENGYIAPPLDGVWATAPYLHNGSVPTLETLLNSSKRPTYWKRTFDNTDYNHTEVGWNYTVETNAPNAQTYNTTLSGYGNYGHTFGDKLNDTERQALLEYLKTL